MTGKAQALAVGPFREPTECAKQCLHRCYLNG